MSVNVSENGQSSVPPFDGRGVIWTINVGCVTLMTRRQFLSRVAELTVTKILSFYCILYNDSIFLCVSYIISYTSFYDCYPLRPISPIPIRNIIRINRWKNIQTCIKDYFWNIYIRFFWWIVLIPTTEYYELYKQLELHLVKREIFIIKVQPI